MFLYLDNHDGTETLHGPIFTENAQIEIKADLRVHITDFKAFMNMILVTPIASINHYIGYAYDESTQQYELKLDTFVFDYDECQYQLATDLAHQSGRTHLIVNDQRRADALEAADAGVITIDATTLADLKVQFKPVPSLERN